MRCTVVFAGGADAKKLAAFRKAVSTENFRRAADALDWIKIHLKMEPSLASVYWYLGKSSRGTRFGTGTTNTVAQENPRLVFQDSTSGLDTFNPGNAVAATC